MLSFSASYLIPSPVYSLTWVRFLKFDMFEVDKSLWCMLLGFWFVRSMHFSAVKFNCCHFLLLTSPILSLFFDLGSILQFAWLELRTRFAVRCLILTFSSGMLAAINIKLETFS